MSYDMFALFFLCDIKEKKSVKDLKRGPEYFPTVVLAVVVG